MSEMASFSRTGEATPSSRERTRSMSSIDKLLVQGTVPSIASAAANRAFVTIHNV